MFVYAGRVSAAGFYASSGALRREISARHRLRDSPAEERELSFGRSGSVLYKADAEGEHGNFLAASYRRIVRDPQWAQRLEKAYTGGQWMPRAGDRRRGELECASSSDALLMNVFCYPGVLRRRALCACLGVEPGMRPCFGFRPALAMQGGEVDRTELDMVLGDVLVEAKLTEGGFGQASRERLLRYCGVEESFSVKDLPQTGRGYAGYQIVRGLLAAARCGGRYVVLLDGRRADLADLCFGVVTAAHAEATRSLFQLRTWQEIAACVPPVVREFLATRFGIEPGT